MKILLAMLLGVALTLNVGCGKFLNINPFNNVSGGNSGSSSPSQEIGMKDVIVPKGFEWSSTKSVALDVKVELDTGSVLSHTAVGVSFEAASGGVVEAEKAYTDGNGLLKTVVQVPSYVVSMKLTVGGHTKNVSVNGDGKVVDRMVVTSGLL